MGHVIKQRDPRARRGLCALERFVDNMVQALRHNTMNEFKTARRGLSPCSSTTSSSSPTRTARRRSSSTFNALFEGGAQIIMTSDRYPKEVPDSRSD